MARILWVDNDPGNIESLLISLRARSHDVRVCRNVSDAELELNKESFDLLILDVMIPVREDELDDYPYDMTGDTMSTGLAFYRRVKQRLNATNTATLVMTVRIDQSIATAFQEAGLGGREFATRYELRDTRQFLARVSAILESRVR